MPSHEQDTDSGPARHPPGAGAKPSARRRHVPQRTCVGCRQVRPKAELLRVVRSPAGAVELDPAARKSGRGAYLCRNPACLERAAKAKSLQRALGVPLIPAVLEQLRAGLEGELSARFGAGPEAQAAVPRPRGGIGHG